MLFSTNFEAYYQAISAKEPGCFAKIRQDINEHYKDISVSPQTGRFLAMIIAMTQRSHILEVGTFCGYSSTWMAIGRPEVRITTCDIQNAHNIEIAETAWASMNVRHQINFVHQDACSLLNTYPQEPTFDMIFVDGKKSDYCDITNKALTLLHPNGFIIFDNVFMRGHAPTQQSESGVHIHTFNQWITQHPQLYTMVIPIGDGLMLATPKSLMSHLS